MYSVRVFKIFKIYCHSFSEIQKFTVPIKTGFLSVCTKDFFESHFHVLNIFCFITFMQLLLIFSSNFSAFMIRFVRRLGGQLCVSGKNIAAFFAAEFSSISPNSSDSFPELIDLMHIENITEYFYFVEEFSK